MGLFTTRQLLGYTEQKVKFRALFLELFFRRTVNFHTEEVMLDKITGKTPVAAYVSPVVEGKVLRHRGGETRVLRPGYVKPKHEFNYQQAVERLPGEDPSTATIRLTAVCVSLPITSNRKSTRLSRWKKCRR
ncbi:major capsid protein [Actinomadura kijaniata]